jgi:undecaprenyl diphosphate synthase
MAERSVPPPDVDPARLPTHVAVILDGNGRWARQRGLPRLAGHREGTKALRRLIEGCVEFGIPVLTIYAFSRENWKRPAPEVRGLMYLVEDVIDRQLDELDANGVQVRHIGWLDRVPPHLAESIGRAVARTAHNQRLILNVAFNYSGRAEIVRAVRRIVEAGIPAAEIDESCIARHLETADLPDPDLVIRTSGEMRLSNFLLWQAAYSEFYSTDTLWPDFDRDTLVAALRSFARRERRYGRVSARPDISNGGTPVAGDVARPQPSA